MSSRYDEFISSLLFSLLFILEIGYDAQSNITIINGAIMHEKNEKE